MSSAKRQKKQGWSCAKLSTDTRRKRGFVASFVKWPMVGRVCLFTVLKHIYAQIIDDEAGRTLAAASTKDKDFSGKTGGNVEAAGVGKQIAEKAKGRRRKRYFRPWRLYLSRARQGFGRGCPRSQFELLTDERRRAARNENREERDSEFVDRLVHINPSPKLLKVVVDSASPLWWYW